MRGADAKSSRIRQKIRRIAEAMRLMVCFRRWTARYRAGGANNPLTQLTESFSALPALKVGTLAALIWIGWPVCGLRPVRAARSFTEKVPTPTG